MDLEEKIKLHFKYLLSGKKQSICQDWTPPVYRQNHQGLARFFKDELDKACSSQLKEVEERIFQDVNIPAEVCKYIREKILAEVERLV